MTTAERRETMTELREAIEEIDGELGSAIYDLGEIRNRIETLREARAWRVAALKDLKASK
jgi:hypothetical protein